MGKLHTPLMLSFNRKLQTLLRLSLGPGPGPAAPEKQQAPADQKQAQGQELGQGHPAEKDRAPVIQGTPEKLHEKAHQARQAEVHQNHLAVEALAGSKPIKKPEDPQGLSGLVELGGMQGHPQGTKGVGVAEDYRPGQVGR